MKSGSKKKSRPMFEHRESPLLPLPAFRARLWRTSLIGLVLILVSLAIGMVGYHFIARQSWSDSFLNAAMILSGMGPVGELTTAGAKIFAGVYALYSGLALISIAGIILSPVIHRFLHRFHLETHKEEKGD
jgi:hypothetical protein